MTASCISFVIFYEPKRCRCRATVLAWEETVPAPGGIGLSQEATDLFGLKGNHQLTHEGSILYVQIAVDI